jgi:tetratricopeptide (TPR) repeat protein
MTVDDLLDNAIRLHQAGRLNDAASAYAVALRTSANNAAAWSNYSDVLRRLGRLDEAIGAGERALRLDPAFAAAHHNLAMALLQAEQFDRAVTSLQRCVELRLRTPQVLLNLGNAMRRAGRIDEAVNAYREALQLNPASADAWNNLGSALQAQGKAGDALAAYEQAIRHRPDFALGYSNLGIVRRELGRVDEALDAHRRALELEPKSPEVLCNYGSALQVAGRAAEAEEMFRRAIAQRPDLPLAHANLGAMLLLRGDYENGWREHEWRLADGRERQFAQPRWNGEDLHGKTILLHSEQGFGDTIQFVRYVPLVAQRGGRIVLACQPPLKQLLARLPDVAHVSTFSEPLPTYDCHLSLMSAPVVFQTRVESIPASAAYLRVDEAKVAAWRARVNLLGGGMKVGLAWTGNPRPDPGRTIPAQLLTRLAECRSIRWVSLQKDAHRNPPPAKLQMIDWTRELHDFDDTAALTMTLDLVISIETVMAHLGGALGRPTWTLLPRMAGWRWLADRDDCPWYPTMRLFRQSTAGDWPDVIERVARQLEAMSHG